MFDKKTLGLFAGLIALVIFIYYLSTTTDLKQFFDFGNFGSNPPSSTDSGEINSRSSFSDLLPTPSPAPEEF